MFKKKFSYPVFLIIIILIIFLLIFGGFLKYRNDTGKNLSHFFSSIISNIQTIIKHRTFQINKPPILKKNKDKKRFVKFIPKKRTALLVLPRYDHALSRSIVEIINLENFKVIHTYKHDILTMNNQVQNIKEFSKLKIDDSPIRFEYRHPLILNDGSLISDSDYSIGFKIDFCSNLEWINDEEVFHHSKMLDSEGNILVGGLLNPNSKYVRKYQIKDFRDDAIIKINSNGKILYKKSIIEILIENEFLPENFAITSPGIAQLALDPIHLNDIEPVFSDSNYWKKGDLFLSLRNLSAIIHYRPETNKVINYIVGPFAQQHDVDIISEKEISIFNNNNFFVNNEYSEVLIYNFETKRFKKMFNNELKEENFKTSTQGLSHILNDGSLMVEEQNHGRIILFNNKGLKEWEFVNKDANDNIGFVSWSRIIEDKLFIEKFRSLVENKKCIN
jgi:hypothetical protein